MSPGREHWQNVYTQRAPDEVSWCEPIPERSLALVEGTGLAPDAAILDVGGGASGLAGALVERGFADVTVADLSAAALDEAQQALGESADRVTWVEADVRDCDFGRRFDLWHDRAVFHFMTGTSDRAAYLAVLKKSLRPGGHLLLATFGPAGPTECSGLPVRRYGPDELSDALGDEFEPVAADLGIHRTPGGSEQQFLHAHYRRRAARV